MYTIVVSYTRNDHLYEFFWETSGHVELPPSVIPPSPHKEKIYHASAVQRLSSQAKKTPKHLPLHQPRGLASPPLPETPTGRVRTRYTAPTGGSKLFRKKTVTSSLCAIGHNELVTVFFLNSFEPPVGAVYRVQTRPVGVSGSGGDARPLG